MQVWIEVQIETQADAADLVAAAVGHLTGGVELRDTETLLSAAAGRSWAFGAMLEGSRSAAPAPAPAASIATVQTTNDVRMSAP